MLKNNTFENVFAKSAKEEGGGGSKNSGKSPLSQTRCISGWPLSLCHRKVMDICRILRLGLIIIVD